ncbi:MAG: STAS-like domain-containing protein [Magnetococcales bacterium]|nr:STAS-like domain-containing protein [Magnetococcales bacterium]
MVLTILEHVDNCHSMDNGETIAKLIKTHLDHNQSVQISFKGVDLVSSSFINTSLIALLDSYSFDTIRSKINFINTTRFINELIKSRFQSANRSQSSPPEYVSS